MQLHFLFHADSLRIPIAYRHLLQGVIYHALEADPAFSGFLHEQGGTIGSRHFKHFTFSPLSGSFRIEGKDIIFSGQITWEVRSADPRFIQTLIYSLRPGCDIRIGNTPVRIVRCSLADHTIFSPQITVRTISPVVAYATLEDGHTLFYAPDVEEFYRSLCLNAWRKYISFFGEEPLGPLQLWPLSSGYKKEVTLFKSTRITAWKGSFVLQADPQYLSFLYQVGLGAKNSQGFGMFSIDDEIRE